MLTRWIVRESGMSDKLTDAEIEELRAKKQAIYEELYEIVKMEMFKASSKLEDIDYEDQEVPCKTHPDAPHGFLRNESLTQNRYVCECEYWEPEEILVECCDGGGPVGAGCYHDHCTGPKPKTKGEERMSKTEYTLNVTWDQVDYIIVSELRKQIDDLNRSLEQREAGHGVPIFEHDIDKDVAMIRDRVRSFEQVLEYYGENR